MRGGIAAALTQNPASAPDDVPDDTGFERPKALAPVDEAARLQRAFIESVHQQGEMLARMERIAGMASLPPSQLRRA